MSCDDDTRSSVEAVITAAREGMAPVELKPGKVYALMTSDGPELTDTDSWTDRPRHTARCPIFGDAGSLVTYLNQRGWPHELADAVGCEELFADLNDLSVTAVLDGAEGWGRDRAALRLKASPEWRAWSEASGRMVRQGDLADFIEDQLSTVAVPDGATLLEIVQSLTGTRKASWTSADWLANGQRALSWVEETEAKAGRKGRLVIPETFTLALRPFMGSATWQVIARLRYQIREGELRIGFKLQEPERVVEAAFGEVVNQIAGTQPIPVMMGRLS